MINLLALVCLSAVAIAQPLVRTGYSTSWRVGQAVTTQNGIIFGRAAANTNVSEYLGIPYAKPPIGSLRFEPPQELDAVHHINATAFGYACVQPGGTGSDGEPQSEDCLTLNLWTKPQVGERKKAILVWIHGGAYSYGSSRTPNYNGEYIADQEDVILISLNYRLGIFGFPGNPSATSNLGLLDLRQALLWIRQNVASFGGDVNRITLFGQSAGAGMIDFYSYGYKSDPIAAGFILMSATVDGFPALSKESTASRWSRIARATGCRSTNANLVTECMKDKTTDDILSAFGSEETAIGAVPAFGPGVDDELVFGNYTSRRASKGAYLIGNNQNEAGLFRLLQPNHTDAYWQDFNDRLYTCADAARLSRAISEGNASWRYRYFGDFENLALSTDPPSGAYHGAELQPLFNTVPQSPIPSTLEQVKVGEYLRGAWATFAKDPEEGLLSYEEGWPKYSSNGDTLVRLAFENRSGRNLAQGNTYDQSC
ncbi:hypothetical protein ACHAPJ_010244 [Fusarium lateritium]